MASDREIAFPQFTERDLRSLARWGVERATAPGDILFSTGDRNFPLFVILEGSVEIIEHSRDTPHVVVEHTEGHFSGDVDMLSGRAALVTARVVRAGRVLAIPPDRLRSLIDELSEIGDLLVKAFLMRRTLLLSAGFEGMRIIGSRFDARAHQLREFVTRNAVPFTWLDLERDDQAEALLREFDVPSDALPVVITADGKWMSNPSLTELGRAVGLDASVRSEDLFDLIVVGAGPAGLAASVYAASEGLRVLTLDAVAAGGQAGTSTRIENYLGFATGISGADLITQALLQAQKFGARITVPRQAVKLKLVGGDRVVVLDDGTEVRGRCVLVASGVQYRRLDLSNLTDYEGAGIYYAATDMEARLCRGDEVVVVGGGNSAGQAIVYLSRYARRVHVVIRGDDLGKNMSRYLVDRVESIENVTIHRACTVSLLTGHGHLEQVQLSYANGEESTINTPAVFLFIGASPNTEWLRHCVQLDRHGFVLTGNAIAAESLNSDTWRGVGRPPLLYLESSLPGIFAAGDVRSGSVKRVASAVGEGSMSVSFVHAHMSTLG